jgi:hypothetical protein
MTHQTTHFMDSSEILGLRVECKHCHMALSLPKSYADTRVENFRRCPNCNEPWTELSNGIGLENAVKRFITALREFEGAMQCHADKGFSLAIEIHVPDVRPWRDDGSPR